MWCMKKGALSLTLCLLLAVVNPSALQAADRSKLLAFGAEAPEIAGLVLNGKPGTKLSDYRGRVVAVDFWASWCGPCLQSMPEFDRMRNQMIAMGHGERFEIVGVNVDRDIPKARRFLEQHPVRYPIIGDPLAIAMSRYGPWKLPATFLLDPQGKVKMIWLGYGDHFAEDIQKMALDLLQDSPAN